MIKEILCGKCLRLLCHIFGMETFCIAAVISLPNPVLVIMNEYMKEVPE